MAEYSSVAHSEVLDEDEKYPKQNENKTILLNQETNEESKTNEQKTNQIEALPNNAVAFELTSVPNAKDLNCISSHFAWLDKWMMYLLWIPISSSNVKRSKKVVFFVKFWYILSCILILLNGVVGVIGDIFFYLDIDSKISISEFFSLCASVLAMAAEILTRYYYYFHFNYLWYNNAADIDHITASNISVSCMVKRYKKIIQLSVLVRFMAPVVVMLLFPFFEPIWALLSIIGPLSALFLAPTFFSVIIQCTICFKYYLYLSQLIAKSATANTNDLLIEYKLLFKAFQQDYNFSLKWCVNLMMASYLWNIWVDIEQTRIVSRMDIDQADSVYLTYNNYFYLSLLINQVISILIVIILYMMSGSLLSDAFDAFQKTLWDNIEEKIDNKKNIILQSTMSLITYTNNYQIVITLGSLRIAKKNVAVFIITLIGTKLAKDYFVFS